MTSEQVKWEKAKEQLTDTIKCLGFPGELGEAVAKNLGSPKAMNRMRVYLENVKPKSVEMVVDEMLAICSEISVWKEKKASQEANARYNEMLNRGLDDLEEDE